MLLVAQPVLASATIVYFFVVGFLLYTVVLSIVTYAVQTVFGTVLLLLAGGEEPVTVASVLTALAASCVAAAFSVLACVYLAQLYRTLRAAREGAAAA